MRLFPHPKPNVLIADAGLQHAFDAAVAEVGQAVRHTPIVIVALNETAPHGVAGQLGAEVHYSASLLKVIAMYTAFELRKAASELLVAASPRPSDVFATLRASFDPIIEQNRVIQLDGVNLDGFLLPRWEEIFQVDPSTSNINFSKPFFGNISMMIGRGSNAAAGSVVQGVGFGYLTKATADAGFFEPAKASQPATADGLWLCGDFGRGFPPQRIPCVNNTPVAEAASALQMARLFTLMASNTLVDGPSDSAMIKLLSKGVARRHFFLNLETSVQFVTLQARIGLGRLNSGEMVASEAAIVRENTTGRRFIIVFQNKHFVNDASIRPLSAIVDATIASYLLS